MVYANLQYVAWKTGSYVHLKNSEDCSLFPLMGASKCVFIQWLRIHILYYINSDIYAVPVNLSGYIVYQFV